MISTTAHQVLCPLAENAAEFHPCSSQDCEKTLTGAEVGGPRLWFCRPDTGKLTGCCSRVFGSLWEHESQDVLLMLSCGLSFMRAGIWVLHPREKGVKISLLEITIS